MSHQPDRFDYLYRQYINRSCTYEEMQELFEYVSDPEKKDRLDAIAYEHLEGLQMPERLPEIDWEYMYNRIILQDSGGVVVRMGDEPEIPKSRFIWKRVAAAAAIIILLSAGAWYFLTRNPKTEMAKTENVDMPYVAPGGNKAILTLADNSTIMLDTAANGTLAKQGSSVVHKTKDGELKYEAGSRKSEIAYNTLSTPRGGQYQLVLPDGSKVWLNAASSIRYPTAFTGTERKVEITGEAYFEVAKNARMPFLVQQGDMTVQVLGTHFNVNGYDDEAALMTTLLEGAVRVTKGGHVTALKPGEQAVAGKTDNSISVVNNPDIAEVMAWKNGQFVFNDATIEFIMHQVERWYDVEVVYDAKISKHFIANIPRSVPLSELLKLLELTDQVHFKIQGRKITILQ